MEKVQDKKHLKSGGKYCVNKLLELSKNQTQTDTLVYSDGRSVCLHSAILSKCSKVFADIINPSETNVILLPPGFSTVLSDFVSIIYTGQNICLTKGSTELLKSLCVELGMETTLVGMSDALDIIIQPDRNKPECLKVETKFIEESSNTSFTLQFPVSRVDQSDRLIDIDFVFNGFKGRVQEEFNISPVGQYEGPYDQDPGVPLFAQLPKSTLNYKKYTEFIHPDEIHCKIFKTKDKHEKIGDLQRIDALEIFDDSDRVFKEMENDENVFYTCKKKCCVIPCPCKLCTVDKSQCSNHHIKHIELFDETGDVISVRSTERSCTDENFFRYSYVLKYPGIPRNCSSCTKDLLHHRSYHLKFHWRCKFCKLYQYKLYPKSSKELKERELKEKAWYNSVCPYCDKKFSEPYQRKRHVEREHMNAKIKCDECPKLFQCQQSLNYHKLTKHASDTAMSYRCEICQKTFVAKVTLDNHIKYKHTEVRKFECSKCDSRFKQRKNLNAHLLFAHGTNPRKEDYWQDKARAFFKCDTCGTEFARKADLKKHFQLQHTKQELFSCDQCRNKYKYEKNLVQHKLEKHGKPVSKFECSDCGKSFSHKRTMEKHQLLHKEN